MPARNHHVSYSKSQNEMNLDGHPGTWSIKGEYSGLQIGNSRWVYIMHRTDITKNQLLKQWEYPTEHVLTHIKVGNSSYEIGD